MKKTLLLILGLCIIMPFVMGVITEVDNLHGVPVKNSGAHNDIYFTQVNITQAGHILNVTLNSSTLATECILYDRNGGSPVLLNTSSISTNVCTFNQPVTVDQEILIGQWKGSYPSSYTFYATSQPQSPVVNETLIFKNTGFRENGNTWYFDNQARFLIVGVGMSYDVPSTNISISLISPIDANISYSPISLIFNTSSVASSYNCSVNLNGTLISNETYTDGQHTVQQSVTNGEYFWNVSCSTPSIYSGTSSTAYFNISLTVPTESALSTNVCPDTLEGVLILALLVVIALFLITLGLLIKFPALGLFGSIMLLILSWTIAGCSSIIALTLGCVSIFLLTAFTLQFLK